MKDNALEKGDVGILVIIGDAYIKELGNKCLFSHNKHINRFCLQLLYASILPSQLLVQIINLIFLGDDACVFFLTMNTPSYCRYIKVRRKK